MSGFPWPELNFWNTGEWDVIREKLDDLVAQGVRINPARKDMFLSLRRTPLKQCKAVLLGQDPYPSSTFATGLAFSVPRDIPISKLPPTLVNIFKEYSNDLRYPAPASGDLSGWAANGVLLWNSIPTCTAGASFSHDWTEYMYLTKEILEKVSAQGAVVALIGGKAQRYHQYIPEGTPVILTSHPSPLAYRGGKTPRNSFLGSRLFSTINAKLCELGKEPINWRLN